MRFSQCFAKSTTVTFNFFLVTPLSACLFVLNYPFTFFCCYLYSVVFKCAIYINDLPSLDLTESGVCSADLPVMTCAFTRTPRLQARTQETCCVICALLRATPIQKREGNTTFTGFTIHVSFSGNVNFSCLNVMHYHGVLFCSGNWLRSLAEEFGALFRYCLRARCEEMFPCGLKPRRFLIGLAGREMGLRTWLLV